MHNRMTPARSSNLDGYIYLGGKYLVVAFKSGAYYRYDEVPQDVADEFAAANSKGKYLNMYIKNAYAWKLLTADELENLLDSYPETKAITASKSARIYTAAEIAQFHVRYPILSVMF
jgi:hypothetical protein